MGVFKSQIIHDILENDQLSFSGRRHEYLFTKEKKVLTWLNVENAQLNAAFHYLSALLRYALEAVDSILLLLNREVVASFVAIRDFLVSNILSIVLF